MRLPVYYMMRYVAIANRAFAEGDAFLRIYALCHAMRLGYKWEWEIEIKE